MAAYQSFLDIIAKVFLALGILAGAIWLLDWLVRERKISPFSAVARFYRRTVDPLLRPIEEKVVRHGGQPSSAPLWLFLGIAITGIAVLQVLRLLGGLFVQAYVVSRSPGRLPLLIVSWALQFLYVALLVRVFTSWLPISPYSKWVRWSYVSTEWLLAPIRRILPPFGALDLSPLAALLLIWLAGSFIG